MYISYIKFCDIIELTYSLYSFLNNVFYFISAIGQADETALFYNDLFSINY